MLKRDEARNPKRALFKYSFRKKQKSVKSTFYIFVEYGKLDLRTVSFLFVMIGVFALSLGTWYTWYSKYHIQAWPTVIVTVIKRVSIGRLTQTDWGQSSWDADFS